MDNEQKLHNSCKSVTKKLSDMRVPLAKGARIIIKGIEIENETEASEVSMDGTTCLFYPKAKIVGGDSVVIGNRVSIKEFYPISKEKVFNIRRNEAGKIIVSEEEKKSKDYIDKKQQFMQGFEKQYELSNSRAMEIATKPWIFGKDHDGEYIISDVNDGECMNRCEFKTLNNILKVSLSLIESFSILFQAEYVMYDLKMDNILWIPVPGYIKIIDTDSLLHKSETIQYIYYNQLYDSPESYNLFEKIKRGERLSKRDYLKSSSNIRSLGNLIFQLVFHEIPDVGQDIHAGDEELMEKFRNIYRNDPFISSPKQLETIARQMVKFFSQVICCMPIKRFHTAQKMMEELEKIYVLLKIDEANIFTSRKKIIEANGTFAAYNLLQKEPLFRYESTENGKKYLNILITGKHSFRKEMLSAILSIGQMLDRELQIHLVSDDASIFWEGYCQINPSLNNALRWKIYDNRDGKMTCVKEKDKYDSNLVARSLAYIQVVDIAPYGDYEDERYDSKLFSEYSYELDEYIRKNHIKYVMLLHEEGEDNQRLITILSQGICKDPKDKMCIAYLSNREDLSVEEESNITKVGKKATLFEISAVHATNRYNEHMFEEQIYRMGRMVHAYYCGAMNGEDEFDMDQLDKEFRGDIYNIASSERCAIHSLYKIASLGMNPSRPGFFKRYYNTIEEQYKLDSISWLEHLSWEAYMLTTGAVPASLDRMKEYAFRGRNDWKGKENPDHIEHPLLVASHIGSKLPRDRSWMELTQNEIEKLDPLDQMSHGIYLWFVEKKEEMMRVIEDFQDDWDAFTDDLPENLREEGISLGDEIVAAGAVAVEHMGCNANNQDKTYVNQWKMLLKKANNVFKGNRKGQKLLEDINQKFRIVVSSYDDRDYKINDECICLAVLDLLGLY